MLSLPTETIIFLKINVLFENQFFKIQLFPFRDLSSSEVDLAAEDSFKTSSAGLETARDGLKNLAETAEATTSLIQSSTG
jgi:hypothetical protein